MPESSGRYGRKVTVDERGVWMKGPRTVVFRSGAPSSTLPPAAEVGPHGGTAWPRRPCEGVIQGRRGGASRAAAKRPHRPAPSVHLPHPGQDTRRRKERIERIPPFSERRTPGALSPPRPRVAHSQPIGPEPAGGDTWGSRTVLFRSGIPMCCRPPGPSNLPARPPGEAATPAPGDRAKPGASRREPSACASSVHGPYCPWAAPAGRPPPPPPR